DEGVEEPEGADLLLDLGPELTRIAEGTVFLDDLVDDLLSVARIGGRGRDHSLGFEQYARDDGAEDASDDADEQGIGMRQCFITAGGAEEVIGDEERGNGDSDADGDSSDEVLGGDGVIPHLDQLRHPCLPSCRSISVRDGHGPTAGQRLATAAEV